MTNRDMDAPPLNEDELNEIYNWVDTIPLSRPKRHIGRDFADGVLMAEIVQHYIPRIVDIHNYSLAHSVQQKQYNWNTLNTKVFRKMGFQITQKDIDAVISVVPEAVERILKVVQVKISMYLDNKEQNQIHQQEKSVEVQQNQNKVSNKQAPNNKSNEKDLIIQDQKETIEILELKIQKLEQLVKLKDSKIQQLMQKLQQAGIK
ncbi:unnamed protein product [Paramecium primaurelia]|uniref:Calponin-homology (CH) domain-containing protein n=1 Tax=Paramecium primaurelia TaxID=5886 RepID=A0A8S1JYY8_PARPR|nr:unnamed protein product [Paramecium primaurelia]